ncbi:MAG: soluble aldose sugar dehydrogenase YliI [Fibrobacteres bacterium]|nr:soluble aldose sugar dehydrogenase YliI [Fibrobacterota bacterium]
MVSTNPFFKQRFSATAALCLAAAISSQAVDLGTYKGCAANDGQFKQTLIFRGPEIPSTRDGNGVLKLAFVSQADASVDVYFIQKRGAVKRYNGKAGTVDSLGLITVDLSREEQGLIGIALRKDFLKKPEVFLMYSATEAGGKYSFRLSRFALTTDLSRVDNASEKILLKIPRESEDWHTGGGMVFDDYGDLWGTVGDNKKTEIGPGNTADLRGGIYRIHPDDSPKGYSVPGDNFGPHLSAYFTSKGNAALAAQYQDTAKVKPEIYVKGTRNAYTITVDPVRRWLAWGDVGPDQGKVSEEHNLVKEPVFGGWPYFAGEEDMSVSGGRFYDNIPSGTNNIPPGSTRAAPLNQEPLATGVKQLPPIREPIFARTTACAMTGPIIRYNGAVKDPGQMPPQLNRKWFNSGCDGFGFHMMTLDSAGEKVLSEQKVFPTISPVTLVDLKQGPDGALYYISWMTGIYRIAYTGACQDETLAAEKTGCAEPGASNYDPNLPKAFNDPRLCAGGTPIVKILRDAQWLRIDRRSISVSAPGEHEIEILDLKGRTLLTLKGHGPMSHEIPALPLPRLYQIRVKTSAGVVVRQLPLI